MSCPHVFLGLLASATVAFNATPSLAQSQTSNSSQPACPKPTRLEALYDAGYWATNESLYRAALELSQRAYAESHLPRDLSQIAQAEWGLKRWPEAAAHIREALSSNDSWIEKNREELIKVQQHIEAGLARAGGRSEDPSQFPSLPISARRTAGWASLATGLILGGVGVTAMSVSFGFNQAFQGFNTDTCPCDAAKAVYNGSFYSGVGFLGAGSAAVLAGAALLFQTRKEKSQPPLATRYTAPANGLAFGVRF